MNHSLTSSFRNPPITSRRSILSQLFALASTTRFSKKDIEFSPTLPANNLEVVIGLLHFDCLRIIHSATCRSLSAIRSVVFSDTSIFHLNLGFYMSCLFSLLLLLLLF